MVAAIRDPFPQVQGGGIAELRAAGVDVEVGLLEAEARRLNAPYLKLVETGRPWIIAKWAMTLDGKIATRDGREPLDFQCRRSREVVHKLRGRVDAIMVGRGTAIAGRSAADRAAAGDCPDFCAAGYRPKGGRDCPLRPARRFASCSTRTPR